MIAVLICAGLFVLGQSAAHLRTDEADSYLFAYYGQQLLDGRLLYSEAWDNKPPGIFWINTLGLVICGGGYGGIIALCVLASATTLWIFYITARRWFGTSAAAIGAIMASLYLFHQAYRGGTNRPETFVVLCDLTAVYFYQRALRTPQNRHWLLCGAMAGLSFVCKQTGIAALLAILFHQFFLLFVSRRSRGVIAKSICMILLGWMISCGLAVIGIAISGNLKWAWDAIIAFPLRYMTSQEGTMPATYWFGATDLLDILALPLILAAGGIIYAFLHRWHIRKRSVPDLPDDDRPVPLLLAWFAIAACLIIVGPNRAFHYVPTALVPLLLLATYSVGILVAQRANNPKLPPNVLRYVAVVWFIYMGTGPIREQILWRNIGIYARSEESDPFNNQKQIALIMRHTQPDESIFLWDYWPRTLWETGRPCASRFHSLLNANQLGANGQYIVDDILTSFKASPPKLIAVSMNRAIRLRNGENTDPDQATGGLDYRDLASFMCERYRPVDPNNFDSVLILQDE